MLYQTYSKQTCFRHTVKYIKLIKNKRGLSSANLSLTGTMIGALHQTILRATLWAYQVLFFVQNWIISISYWMVILGGGGKAWQLWFCTNGQLDGNESKILKNESLFCRIWKLIHLQKSRDNWDILIFWKWEQNKRFQMWYYMCDIF